MARMKWLLLHAMAHPAMSLIHIKAETTRAPILRKIERGGLRPPFGPCRNLGRRPR
jgi:hypothetical protein